VVGLSECSIHGRWLREDPRIRDDGEELLDDGLAQSNLCGPCESSGDDIEGPSVSGQIRAMGVQQSARV
jgi:hypothetical protein